MGTVQVLLMDASTPPSPRAWGKVPPGVTHPVSVDSTTVKGEREGREREGEKGWVLIRNCSCMLLTVDLAKKVLPRVIIYGGK